VRPSPPSRPATRAEPLVEHSGELAGPIPWIVAETASAPADAPIIALLHGRGDEPERFVALAYRLAAHLDTPVRFVVARAPLPFGMAQGRQWFDAAEGTPEAVLGRRLDDMRAFLDRVAATWPKAPRPILVGFSQGGMMALHTAVAEPARVGGAASLSGGFAVDLGTAPEATARPPILVATGDRDGVVPPERTRAAADWLAARGFAVERVEFRGAHRITDEVVKATGTWISRLIARP
jgi:phospholipase/carboxylesterase